jgi:LPXTG-site transpeptidase (sortase) family protein
MTDANGASNGDAPASWPTTGLGSPRPVATARAEPLPRRVLATAGFLLDTTRRRRSGRAVLWSLVLALSLTGVYMLAYPIISDFWAHRIQNGLEKQFDNLQTGPGYTIKPAVGSALTRMQIPKIGVNKIVVEGTSGNALRAGLGHYVESALPGASSGNIAIAGHRTGFGEPFRHLEKMRQGDKVILITPFGKYTYAVIGPFDGHSNPWITAPNDWSVIQPTPDAELTLTTCDPPHTSLRRLIVRARLVASAPLK